ncbi:MAG TPA: phosphate ABC transporter permease PstA [Actinomycetota bacterium]|nr:phosphate ABC transporter permease PstA [Actinomycetota bacterium]
MATRLSPTELRCSDTLRTKDRAFRWVLLAGATTTIAILLVLVADIVRDGAGRLSPEFFTSYASRFASRAGLRAPLLGTLWLMGLCSVLTVPLGVGAAIYLEEFAPSNRWTRLIETNIANLAGVPSIVYGLLGLGLFVRGLNLGKVVLAGALTLSLLVLPIVIIASREALRAVPGAIRDGAMALGATRWQAVRYEVLPAAIPGVMTGTILALSRAIGETAPLITLGAFTFVAFDPRGPFDTFTAIPIQILGWAIRPQEAFHEIAAAASIVLLVVLLGMNAFAIWLRNRYRREW